MAGGGAEVKSATLTRVAPQNTIGYNLCHEKEPPYLMTEHERPDQSLVKQQAELPTQEKMKITLTIPLHQVVFRRHEQRFSHKKAFGDRVSDEQVLLLDSIGMERREIATRFKVPYSRVNGAISRLRKQGEDIPYKATALSLKEKQRLLDDVKALDAKNQTVDEMSATLNVNQWQVHQARQTLLASGEIKPRTPSYPRNLRGKVKDIFEQHIREHPDEPINLSEVARQIECTPERVRQLYRSLAKENPTSVPPKKSRSTPQQISALKSRLLALRAQGYTDREIAKQLGIPTSRVNSYTHELSQTSILPNRQSKTTETDEKVLRLRQEGKGDKEIASILGISKRQATTSIARLEARGESVRLRNKRRSPEEMAVVDQQVKPLFEQGLTYSQISKRLNESVFTIMHAVRRLLRKGEIQRRIER